MSASVLSRKLEFTRTPPESPPPSPPRPPPRAVTQAAAGAAAKAAAEGRRRRSTHGSRCACSRGSARRTSRSQRPKVPPT